MASIIPLILLALTVHCVAPEESRFRIYADSGGLFGAFAHDHVIETKAIRGCVNIDPQQLEASSVNLTFLSAGLKVLDPSASAKDRAKIQSTMEEEVLRVMDFAEIRFRSQAVKATLRSNSPPSQRHELQLQGSLTIRDATRTILIPLHLEALDSGAYSVSGKVSLRQTAFGIKPIRLMGGTVRVKDEIRIEFELLLKPRR